MNKSLTPTWPDTDELTLEGAELLSALDALQPGGQRQKRALFSKAYPSIVRAIARQVPQKDILAALSDGGLKLHPVRYREMLDAEKKLHEERGESICCQSCGAVLAISAGEPVALQSSMASKLARTITEE